MLNLEKIFDSSKRSLFSLFYFEKSLNFFKGDTKQFLILTRHFFHRLFLNDIVSFEEQMKEKIIAVLAILAIFCSFLSNLVLSQYLFTPDKGTSWIEKCYAFSFFMILIGLATILEWEVIFPDSRDFSNLMSLPVKARTLFCAKFASLFFFVGMFVLGANSVAALVFAYYLVPWRSKSLIYFFRFIFVHLISAFASNFFIFFAIALLIGLLMAVLGYKIFSQVSVYIRTLLMIVFLFLVFLFLADPYFVPRTFSSFPSLKANNSIFLRLFPPMWFVGLYETLLGSKDSFFSTLALYALLALFVPAIAFFLTAAVGYRGYLKRMQEARREVLRFFRFKKFFLSIFNALFIRHPVQKAVFYFFGKTIRRSNVHKIRLASYMAVSVGLILFLLASKIKNVESFSSANKTMLSIPLILSFFLLLGMRHIVNIPASLEANWVFKLTEIKNRKHYFSSLRKGIFFFSLVPLFILLFVFYFFLWGLKIAGYHCLYGLVISVLLMEGFFWNYRKIPFTCSYLPGRARIHLFWWAYIFSFLGYVVFMSLIEFELLKKPSNFIIFFIVAFGIFAALKVFQNYFLYKEIKIIFEEKPEPVMITLVPYD
jgi:hypothetical protein